jgi:hypothetical protein
MDINAPLAAVYDIIRKALVVVSFAGDMIPDESRWLSIEVTGKRR